MIGIGVSPFFLKKNYGASTPPVPYGNILYEDFNPQKLSYDDGYGNPAYSITPGNLAISGNNGTFNKGLLITNLLWNGNNWYFKAKFNHTRTNAGDIGLSFGLLSANPFSNPSVTFGPYAFEGNNSIIIRIFGINPFTGPIAISPGPLIVSAGEELLMEASFVESVFTVKVTNLDTPNSQTAQYTYDYTYPTTGGINFLKPNTGRLIIFGPTITGNVTEMTFGTNYLKKVDLVVQGDSISSGYYQESESQRWVNQFCAATNKTFALFAGSGDRTLELSYIIALDNYTKVEPKKVILYAGINDIGSGLLITTAISNLQYMVSRWKTSYPTCLVYVAQLTPYSALASQIAIFNSMLPTLTDCTIIDWHDEFEDPSNPGALNPIYNCGDGGLHPNALMATAMSNYLISLGI